MECSSNRFVIHGLAVELSLCVPALESVVQQLLGPFADPIWPDGFVPTLGSIREFDHAEVSRCLSPTATPIQVPQPTVDLYQDAERFWLIDDRWGMVELNLLKNQFRAWILPQLRVDDLTCAENAILWPIAQLLRARGLHLIPAVSVARDGWGVLLISPFSLERELRALAESGYQIISQRWTALRDESDQISLLHLPWPTQRAFCSGRGTHSRGLSDQWIDLFYEYANVQRHHAFCETVLMILPGRRARVQRHDLTITEAASALRHDWPIHELTHHRRAPQMASRLLDRCRVGQIQLSRHVDEFLLLLDAMRPMTRLASSKTFDRATPPVVA